MAIQSNFKRASIRLNYRDKTSYAVSKINPTASNDQLMNLAKAIRVFQGGPAIDDILLIKEDTLINA